MEFDATAYRHACDRLSTKDNENSKTDGCWSLLSIGISKILSRFYRLHQLTTSHGNPSTITLCQHDCIQAYRLLSSTALYSTFFSISSCRHLSSPNSMS